jgi:hypothetical protein
MDMTDPQNISPIKSPEPPTHPKPNGKRTRVSERGLLSLVTTFISVFSLLVMMAGWLKLTLDIFEVGLTVAMEQGLWSKIIALGLAFLFGWLAAVLSIRVFGNLVLPMIISGLVWIVLADWDCFPLHSDPQPPFQSGIYERTFFGLPADDGGWSAGAGGPASHPGGA